MNLLTAGIGLIGVGLVGAAFRLVTTRPAKDSRYDWCQTNRLASMDNDGWYVFEGGLILIGVSLVAAGIV